MLNRSVRLTANIFESGPMPTPACQSSQVVNWVKTKPELAVGGTRFGFTTVGVYNRGIIDWFLRREFDFLLTQA